VPTNDKAAAELQAVLDKIASWPEPFPAIGQQLHETILSAGPKLKPRLWYGGPGYAAGRSTPVMVFFRVDDGVMSLGVSEKAHAERETDSLLMPAAFYVDEVDERTLERVARLVRAAFARP